MNKTLYVMKDGILKRKNDTLMMETKDGATSFVPVEAIEEIFVMGAVEMTTGLMELLNLKGITLHVFNYYGHHVGTWLPTAKGDGDALLAQAAFWLDEDRRHGLAAAFVSGASSSFLGLYTFR